MKKVSTREVLSLSKQSSQVKLVQKWDRKALWFSCQCSIRWDQTFNCLMGFGSRPSSYMSPLHPTPPSTVIFSLDLGSYDPYVCSWNRTLNSTWLCLRHGFLLQGPWSHVSFTPRQYTGSIQAFPKCYCSCGHNFLSISSLKNLGAYPRKGRSQTWEGERNSTGPSLCSVPGFKNV